jgi:hypothetical protein
MNDPQERVGRGQWFSHNGPIWIDTLGDEYLLNCYKTCLRHGNMKADELLEEIKNRNMEWRLDTCRLASGARSAQKQSAR